MRERVCCRKTIPGSAARLTAAMWPEADLAVHMDHVFGSLQDIAAQAGQLRAVHAEACRHSAWRRETGRAIRRDDAWWPMMLSIALQVNRMNK